MSKIWYSQRYSTLCLNCTFPTTFRTIDPVKRSIRNEERNVFLARSVRARATESVMAEGFLVEDAW